MNFFQILFIISIICLFFAVGMILFLRKKYRKTIPLQQYKNILENFEQKILYLEAEVKRLNFLLENYKNRNVFSQEKHRETENKSQIPFSTENVETQLRILAQEKENLEAEKENFKLKNKKLWDQSIAIHKEKERIDALRRDIELRHKEITDSIAYAQRIQTAMLPPLEIFANSFTDFGLLYLPRNIVSGDFYWVKESDEQIFLALADCTGHGVPGAFVSMLGIAFLNEITAKNQHFKPSEVLEELRKRVKTSLRQSYENKISHDGMDVAFCQIFKRSNSLIFAGANQSLYQIRNFEVTEFKPVKNPVGIHVKEFPFTDTEIAILPDDVYCLSSDGYPDQFGGTDKYLKFMKKNFISFLIETLKTETSLSRVKEILHQKHLEWKNKQHQTDDVTVLVFKV